MSAGNRRKRRIKRTTKNIIKNAVSKSIEKLFDEANKEYKKGNVERSKRYIEMIMELVKKNKVRLPDKLRNAFCRKCHILWIPGETIKVVYDKRHNCLRIKCKCGYTKRV